MRKGDLIGAEDATEFRAQHVFEDSGNGIGKDETAQVFIRRLLSHYSHVSQIDAFAMHTGSELHFTEHLRHFLGKFVTKEVR